MNDLSRSRKQAFKDKDYRHGYVDEFLNASIATQIKVLREQRGWSQKELAKRTGMKQPRISVMENVNYSAWSVSVLRKLAEAFDLALCVSFVSFGRRVNDISELNRKSLERDSFDQDPVFQAKEDSHSFAADTTEYPVVPSAKVFLIEEYIVHKNAVSAKEYAPTAETIAANTTSVMTI